MKVTVEMEDKNGQIEQRTAEFELREDAAMQVRMAAAAVEYEPIDAVMTIIEAMFGEV